MLASASALAVKAQPNENREKRVAMRRTIQLATPERVTSGQRTEPLPREPEEWRQRSASPCRKLRLPANSLASSHSPLTPTSCPVPGWRPRDRPPSHAQGRDGASESPRSGLLIRLLRHMPVGAWRPAVAPARTALLRVHPASLHATLWRLSCEAARPAFFAHVTIRRACSSRQAAKVRIASIWATAFNPKT